jgi:hypothetical protein
VSGALCVGEDPVGGTPAEQARIAATLCPVCPERAACAQSAADAPFTAVGVWGGMVLPGERALLPGPTLQAVYVDEPHHERTKDNPLGAGRPDGFERSGRNFDPALVR